MLEREKVPGCATLESILHGLHVPKSNTMVPRRKNPSKRDKNDGLVYVYVFPKVGAHVMFEQVDGDVILSKFK